MLMVIIHVSVQLGLSPILIIPPIQYTSIIITTDIQIVIFYDGLSIVIGENTINEKSMPPPFCCHTNPSL